MIDHDDVMVVHLPDKAGGEDIVRSPFCIKTPVVEHDHPVTVASRERQVVQDDEDQRTLPSEPQGTCHDGFLVAQVERRRWLIQ